MKSPNVRFLSPCRERGVFIIFLVCLVGWRATAPAADLKCAVSLSPTLTSAPVDGRLFVLITDSARPEPRMRLGRTGAEAPLLALAQDVSAFGPGQTSVLDRTTFA